MLQGWLTAVPFQQDHREYFKLKIIQSTVVVSSAMVPVAERQEHVVALSKTITECSHSRISTSATTVV